MKLICNQFLICVHRSGNLIHACPRRWEGSWHNKMNPVEFSSISIIRRWGACHLVHRKLKIYLSLERGSSALQVFFLFYLINYSNKLAPNLLIKTDIAQFCCGLHELRGFSSIILTYGLSCILSFVKYGVTSRLLCLDIQDGVHIR